MGVGLTPDSPVKLTLNKLNYEGLIDRHGQWCRWKTANKCPCAEKDTQQPDPSCEKCGGLGVVYSYQSKVQETIPTVVLDDTGILVLDEKYIDTRLVKVIGFYGEEYKAEKAGVYIILDNPPEKSRPVTVILERETAIEISEIELKEVKDRYYKIENLVSTAYEIEGITHTAPCDILDIEAIEDKTGRTWEVEELRLDMVRLKRQIETIDDIEVEITPVEPVKAINVRYIPPFIFALLSQSLNKQDTETMIEARGDAVLSFPYFCDVGDGDLITALAGTNTHKEVVTRQLRADRNDTIGAYFVSEIVKCVGRNREYIEGEDFILVGTNYLHWLCNDRPEPGEPYSITYHVYPTYRVIKNIPMLRTSENQRLPRKAIVEAYTTYGEARKVNRQW